MSTIDFGTPVDTSTSYASTSASQSAAFFVDNTADASASVTVTAQASVIGAIPAGLETEAWHTVRLEIPYTLTRSVEVVSCETLGGCPAEVRIPVQTITVNAHYSGAVAEAQGIQIGSAGTALVDPGLPDVSPLSVSGAVSDTNKTTPFDNTRQDEACAGESLPDLPRPEVEASVEFPLDFRLWKDQFPPFAEHEDQTFVQSFDGTLTLEFALYAQSLFGNGRDAIACVGQDSPLVFPNLTPPDCGDGLVVTVTVEEAKTATFRIAALPFRPGRVLVSLPAPPPTDVVVPKELSANGSVVVGEAIATDGPYAFRWEDGVFELLDDLPGSFGTTATDVSADGSVVVGYGDSGPGRQAFRWQNGVHTLLGDLAGGGFDSAANAVSADGSVVVGRGLTAGGFRAFRWQGGVMTDLGADGFYSSAVGVSDDGSVVVGNRDDTLGARGFRFASSTFSDVTDSGGSHTILSGVSGDGTEIFGAGIWNIAPVPPFTTALRFEDGPGTVVGGSAEFDAAASPPGDFEIPGENGIRSIAVASTADGAVVVGRGAAGSPYVAPTIWDRVRGLRPLQVALERDFGLDLGGWLLTEVASISADGTTLVGRGISPQGVEEAWLATIPQIRPTQPGALVTLQALGGPGVSGGLQATFDSIDEPDGGALTALNGIVPSADFEKFARFDRSPFFVPTEPLQFWEVSHIGAFSGNVSITFHYDDGLPFLADLDESSFSVQRMVAVSPGCTWGVDCGLLSLPTVVNTAANTATVTTSFLYEPPRATSTDETVFQGTAAGGFVDVRVSGVVLRVYTAAGQSAQEVAALLAAAINSEGALVAASISARADGGRLETTGEFESVKITDRGLDPPPVPAIGPRGRLATALLLAAVVFAEAARRKRASRRGPR